MALKRVPKATPATPPMVLIIDADTDTRALYRCAFEPQGYEIVEAADGRDALAKALARPPAVVVMELRLAYIDGYALCEILRRDRTTKSVPVLVVAADTDLAHQQRARRAGANVVLVKPASIDAVVSELHRLLNSEQPAPVLVSEQLVLPHRSLSKSFARSTAVAEELPGLALHCPSCDELLRYERSHIGGVNAQNAERWDDYSCGSCGMFQYRHRTRKLRRAAPSAHGNG